MAFSNLGNDALVPRALWEHDAVTPPRLLDVLSQMAHFLDQLGYTRTFTSLLKEAKASGIEVDIAGWESAIEHGDGKPFLELFAAYNGVNGGYPTLASSKETPAAVDSSSASDSESDSDSESESSSNDSNSESSAAAGALIDVEAEETDDDGSDSDSSSDDSSSDEAPVLAVGGKRKRVVTPPSSDSDSDSDSSSDESEQTPVAKKVKIENSNDEGSIESNNDSSSSSDASEVGTGLPSDSDSSSEESSSESDSSENESEAPARSLSPKKKSKAKDTNAKVAKSKVEATKPKVDTQQAAHDDDDASSATLQGDAPSQMHPDRLSRMPGAFAAKPSNGKGAKKEPVVPFSRISADQFVDPKFASNAYVPYDYAERAHRDLIVTKGKGFTKEKNKKKRGSYRGGTIDFTPKGIKFDD